MKIRNQHIVIVMDYQKCLPSAAIQVVWNGSGFIYGGGVNVDKVAPVGGVAYDSNNRHFLLAAGGCWQPATAKETGIFLREVASVGVAAQAAGSCLVFVSDDGARADFRMLGPLARDGVPFTLSLVRDFLTGGKRQDQMTVGEVDEMVGWGCEVAAHGLTHKALLKMSDDRMREEVEGSVKYLREHGWTVSSFIYPFGSCNTKARQLLWDLGLSGCVTHGGAVGRVMDRTAIPRIAFGSFLRPRMATTEQYKALVDQAHAANKMLVFMLHPEEPRHDASQQRALVEVIEHARRIGMRITTLREAVNLHGPRWQERPRSLRQWQVDHNGRLRRVWTGGSAAKAGWNWLIGDSPLREVLWNTRGSVRKIIGRKGKHEVTTESKV